MKLIFSLHTKAVAYIEKGKVIDIFLTNRDLATLNKSFVEIEISAKKPSTSRTAKKGNI